MKSLERENSPAFYSVLHYDLIHNRKELFRAPGEKGLSSLPSAGRESEKRNGGKVKPGCVGSYLFEADGSNIISRLIPHDSLDFLTFHSY